MDKKILVEGSSLFYSMNNTFDEYVYYQINCTDRYFLFLNGVVLEAWFGPRKLISVEIFALCEKSFLKNFIMNRILL